MCSGTHIPMASSLLLLSSLGKVYNLFMCSGTHMPTVNNKASIVSQKSPICKQKDSNYKPKELPNKQVFAKTLNFKNEKSAQRGSFWDGHPADIWRSFARISRPKNSVWAVKILEKQAFRRGHPWPEGADVHNPKGFPKTSVRKELWAEFSVPTIVSRELPAVSTRAASRLNVGILPYDRDFHFLLQDPTTPEGFQKGFRRGLWRGLWRVSEGFLKGFRRGPRPQRPLLLKPFRGRWVL